MESRSLRSLIIPFCAGLALLWVFSRPLSSLGLFVYNFTGAQANNVYEHIKETQQEAADLLAAERRAEEFETINRELIIENTSLKSQVLETDSLKAAMDFKKSFNYQTIPGQIIGRSPDTWHKQIIINKGSKDGVKIERGVLTEHGIIGQVKKLSAHNAVVQLIFNPDWRMGVKIARLNQYGVLSGNFPGPAALEFITVDSPVEIGDEIVTSGICIDTANCPYPENFPVGRVVAVNRDPNVVDLVVKVKFYEDLTSLKNIFVLN